MGGGGGEGGGFYNQNPPLKGTEISNVAADWHFWVPSNNYVVYGLALCPTPFGGTLFA